MDEFGKRKVTYNDFTWTEQQLIENKEIISAYYKMEIECDHGREPLIKVDWMFLKLKLCSWHV